MCTPLFSGSLVGGGSDADFSATLNSCDPVSGAVSLSIFSYISPGNAGAAEQCVGNSNLVTLIPGTCMSSRGSSGSGKAYLKLAEFPTCDPPQPGSVFTLESFDRGQCQTWSFLGHQAVTPGACVAGGFRDAEDTFFSTQGALVGAGRQSLRLIKYPAGAGGCSGPPALSVPIPDLTLPAAASTGPCNASAGSSFSYRLLAPKAMSPSRSPSPTPTLSPGASPSSAPTPSSSPSPSPSPSFGSSAPDNAPSDAAAGLSRAAVITVSVVAPLGLCALLALVFLLRRLCYDKSITWRKDGDSVETVVVQSPMRPNIYRPTVKETLSPASSGKRKSSWGFAV